MAGKRCNAGGFTGSSLSRKDDLEASGSGGCPGYASYSRVVLTGTYQDTPICERLQLAKTVQFHAVGEVLKKVQETGMRTGKD